MNQLKLIIALLKGENIWATLSKIFTISGTLLGSADANDTGVDDTIASILLSASEGLDAYQKKDMNKFGRVIDAIIVSLTALKASINTLPSSSTDVSTEKTK